ncbi:MAG: transposase [Nitrososphaerota archaeon]|nr:transposase [Nitrososphaerota archaeon]
MAYIDDASRMVTGWGLFDEATADNALLVLDEAIATWGRPSAIMTDHGSQFFANYGDNKAPGVASFQEHLAKLGIRHILERVGHPQSNGKVERLFGSLQLRIKHFNSVEEYVTYYNERRPHMSLDFDNLETPVQAFYRKWDRRRKLPVQQLGYGGMEI